MVESWFNRQLERRYLVVYIDAIHQKVRRETVATEAFYVLLGLKDDHTREVLGIVNIPQESASGWEEVLLNIKSRGVGEVGLFVFDDLTGLGTVIGKVYSNSMQQKCTIHFQRNLSKHIRRSSKEEFCQQLKRVFDPDNAQHTIEQAILSLKEVLTHWSKTYPKQPTSQPTS
jgi:transposase-like protein